MAPVARLDSHTLSDLIRVQPQPVSNPTCRISRRLESPNFPDKNLPRNKSTNTQPFIQLLWEVIIYSLFGMEELVATRQNILFLQNKKTYIQSHNVHLKSIIPKHIHTHTPTHTHTHTHIHTPTPPPPPTHTHTHTHTTCIHAQLCTNTLHLLHWLPHDVDSESEVFSVTGFCCPPPPCLPDCP